MKPREFWIILSDDEEIEFQNPELVCWAVYPEDEPISKNHILVREVVNMFNGNELVNFIASGIIKKTLGIIVFVLGLAAIAYLIGYNAGFKAEEKDCLDSLTGLSCPLKKN